MFNFFKKNLTHSEFQKLFLETSSEVFDDFFLKNSFKKVKSVSNLSESKIVYNHQKKFIEIFSCNELDPRGESFFEINIGEKYSFEINEFEVYYISLNRYSSIINTKKKESHYTFPFGEKQCQKSLKKAKKDFIKYFEFYLAKEDENLFEKVLKLKSIRN